MVKEIFMFYYFKDMLTQGYFVRRKVFAFEKQVANL